MWRYALAPAVERRAWEEGPLLSSEALVSASGAAVDNCARAMGELSEEGRSRMDAGCFGALESPLRPARGVCRRGFMQSGGP